MRYNFGNTSRHSSERVNMPTRSDWTSSPTDWTENLFAIIISCSAFGMPTRSDPNSTLTHKVGTPNI
ncbi:hypothetical protein CsSME_00046927 [Camellia sinensis var. sinensis]